MRNLRLLVLLVPALLLPLACEDSSSSSGGVFNPEAGPGFDAGPLPEAGPVPDVDASVPPVTLGVTVTVTDGTAPLKDVRVIQQDATGAVTGETRTDATGKTTIAKAPSMVTVLTGATSYGALSLTASPVTFLSVADGDKLSVVAASSAMTPPPIGQYSVTMAGAGFVAAATTFSINTGGGCSGTTNDVASTVVISLLPSCVAAQNAVLARADNGPVLGFGFAKNVLKPAMANANVDVGPITFAAPGTTTLQAANFPISDARVARLFAIANGAAFELSSGAPIGGITIDDPAGATYSTPTGFAEAYQSEVFAQKQGGDVATAIIRRETTTAPATVTLPPFDFATALPFVDGVTVTKPVPARPDVTLKSATPLTSSDAGIVTLRWSTVQPTVQAGRWTFVIPPGTTSFKVPALPADAPTFVPANDVFAEAAAFVDATQLPGYKEFKLLPVFTNLAIPAVPLSPGSGSLAYQAATALPSAGTVRLSLWTSLAP